MQTQEMALLLQDVRKAYHLIADYQQRIIELLDFIKKELNAEHYWQELENSYTSSSIKNIYTDQNAGKKLLPMLDMHLLWHKIIDIPEGQYWQDVVQPNDTVFDIYIKNCDSKSEIHIYVYKCIKYTRKIDWYNDVWRKSKIEYPILDTVWGYKNAFGDIEYQIYGESIDLAELVNEEAVRKALTKFRENATKKLGLEI